MGATVMWRALKSGKAVPGKGQLRELLESAFDREFPFRLTAEHVPVLEALGRTNVAFTTALNELSDAVRTHKEIEVWAEY